MMRYLALPLLVVLFQLPGTAQNVPEIPFDAQDVLKMPPDLYVGEVAGVALNSRRHIFVYTRTGADDGGTDKQGRKERDEQPCARAAHCQS